jgi:glucokinase
MGAPKSRTAKEVFLVGDVGGTRTRLALHGPEGRAPLVEAVLPSRDYASFEEAAETFLEGTAFDRPRAAVIGVAGPVQAGVVATTNLPWRLDERVLVRRLGIPRVLLANDLVVGARGCLEITARDMVLLTNARPARQGEHLGVVAAGTGLGEARLVWTGERYLPLATEGGHCDFAPRSELEAELWAFLARRHPDHVSAERVVSGAGLGALYDFFAARSRTSEPRGVSERLADGDRNAVIAEIGLAREYGPAADAVDLFARIYGAEAGNVALRELATGGVYVLGNIARTIVPARREIFLEGFRAKGRFYDLLATVPIAVVTDPLVGLRGALAMAREEPALPGASRSGALEKRPTSKGAKRPTSKTAKRPAKSAKRAKLAAASRR